MFYSRLTVEQFVIKVFYRDPMSPLLDMDKHLNNGPVLIDRDGGHWSLHRTSRNFRL